MKPTPLAWRKYPEPNGTTYFTVDLIDKSKVIQLFDFCQILEASIWDTGWNFLFENYGLNEILEIDTESGWLNDEDLGAWISSIYYNSFISGFDPQNMEYGNYSDEKGTFTNKEGVEREINWKEIYDLKN
ncbi:hypothetical protein [uncultured Kordia sp.]|uniref:hypothetical protein n=1 Tax=uncultured Kordia sp. TaxID=507699 RepID=UPI00262CC62B|nr:hypothetical protein [uncultured Kordia sp.]